jgi:transposase
VFPELRQVFKDVTCKGAIATLRLFPMNRLHLTEQKN